MLFRMAKCLTELQELKSQAQQKFKSKKHIWALHKKYGYVNLSTKLQSYICERKGITLYFHVQSYILFKLCL